MTVDMLWSSCVLVVLVSAHAAHSSKGLSCVNDFVSNVSCTWSGAPVAPGVDCWIFGVKRTWIYKDYSRKQELIKQSCKLKQDTNSPSGCSFVIGNKAFNFFEYMPHIGVECNGTLVENLTQYKPCDHIKMHPPGVPNVSKTTNETWISWSPGSPRSKLIKSFDFEVQVKDKKQAWEEAKTFFTQDQELRMASWQLKCHCKVRVRVKPFIPNDSHWSSWSPTTSWVAAAQVETSQDQDWLWILRAVLLSVFVFILMLILYMTCVSRGCLNGKPVPNPSKYFHTLHSVHGGNLKKWLNPLSASESFFMAQPCNHISPVEVCKSWDVVPSTSPSSSSTSALLQFTSYPTAGTDTSGINDNSSSSSLSCFSNVGYFMSRSSDSTARTDPSPAYFTYQGDFQSVNSGHDLHLSFSPLLSTSPAYETLKREPQSPDSGFGIGNEDEEDRKDERGLDLEEEGLSFDHQSSPFLILPLHLPSRLCPPCSAPSPPHADSLTQKSSDTQQVDAPVAAASGSYEACSMCRSSSMPVEHCKTGYLTLKELQTTFSNKSI